MPYTLYVVAFDFAHIIDTGDLCSLYLCVYSNSETATSLWLVVVYSCLHKKVAIAYV